MIYDCIVVGAGPAGASAAYHLARRGLSVALIEKQKLPRYKPCGGAVLMNVTQWFDFDFTPAISAKVDRIVTRNLRPGGYSGEMELPRPVWMVRREVFDHFLVRQACARGAALMDGLAATRLIARDESWIVDCGDTRVEGRYLIAADGAKGPLARWLGFETRRRMLVGAIEAEVPARQPPEPVLHLEFQSGLTGYAWNFPKADSHSVGIGEWRVEGAPGRRAEPLRAQLERYCQGFGLDMSSGSIVGHPIVVWNGVQALHTHRALLAGEAACIVDPWTGEGIRPAMIGGARAAEAIAAAFDGRGDAALAGYSEAIAGDASEMTIASAMATRFYFDERSPGIPNREMLRLSARLYCGEIGYRQFTMGSMLLRLLGAA